MGRGDSKTWKGVTAIYGVGCLQFIGMVDSKTCGGVIARLSDGKIRYSFSQIRWDGSSWRR